MYQRKEKVLAVSVTCPTTVDVGDPVVLYDDLEVKAISAAADNKLLGTVCKHLDGAAVCTVETRFRERRDDRVAAADIGVGPFVWDANGKAVAFTQAFQATVTGTAEETYAITLDTNDHVKVSINGGSGQDITLTAGETRTAAQVAADINAVATGFTADGTTGYVKLTADNIGEDLAIQTVTHDAYTTLGFTVATTHGDASHDPSAIVGVVLKGPQPLEVEGVVQGPFAIVNNTNDAMKIKIAGGGSQTFDLTAGTAQTSTQVAADINATATGFTAVPVRSKIKLVCDDPGDSLQIETVANSAYATLGLTAATYAAPMTIETLEK